jgi:hypothetical protein
MNERIRELYEQARLQAKSIDADIDPKGWMDLYHQKFAELIVKECILTIQMGITRDGPTTEKFLRSMKHIKQIKEHFGVEE